jgi:hypothetical protein
MSLESAPVRTRSNRRSRAVLPKNEAPRPQFRTIRAHSASLRDTLHAGISLSSRWPVQDVQTADKETTSTLCCSRRDRNFTRGGGCCTRPLGSNTRVLRRCFVGGLPAGVGATAPAPAPAPAPPPAPAPSPPGALTAAGSPRKRCADVSRAAGGATGQCLGALAGGAKSSAVGSLCKAASSSKLGDAGRLMAVPRMTALGSGCRRRCAGRRPPSTAPEPRPWDPTPAAGCAACLPGVFSSSSINCLPRSALAAERCTLRPAPV